MHATGGVQGGGATGSGGAAPVDAGIAGAGWLAYMADETLGDGGKLHTKLFAVDLSRPGFPRTDLTADKPPGAYVNYFQFSLDGHHLAYVLTEFFPDAALSSNSLYFVDFSSGAPQKSVPVDAPGIDGNLFRFSPDSKSLAYGARRNGQLSLRTVDVSGAAPSTPMVVDGDVLDGWIDFDWVGNDVLVYQFYETRGATTIRWAKRAGSAWAAPQDLPFTGDPTYSVSFTPPNPPVGLIQGHLVHFDTGAVSDPPSGLMSTDLRHSAAWLGTSVSLYPTEGPTPPAALATFAASQRSSSCGHDVWSHDGSTYAWSDPGMHVEIVNLGRSAPLTAARVGGPYGQVCDEFFSPDDKWIAIGNQLKSLFVSRIDGAAPTDAVQVGDPANAASITEPVTDFLGFAPDGHALAYTGPVQGGTLLYFSSLESGSLGPPERAARVGADHTGWYSWSGDSSLLAYSVRGASLGDSEGISIIGTRSPLSAALTIVPHPDCKGTTENCRHVYFWQFQHSSPHGFGR